MTKYSNKHIDREVPIPSDFFREICFFIVLDVRFNIAFLSKTFSVFYTTT